MVNKPLIRHCFCHDFSFVCVRRWMGVSWVSKGEDQWRDVFAIYGSWLTQSPQVSWQISTYPPLKPVSFFFFQGTLPETAAIIGRAYGQFQWGTKGAIGQAAGTLTLLPASYQCLSSLCFKGSWLWRWEMCEISWGLFQCKEDSYIKCLWYYIYGISFFIW